MQRNRWVPKAGDYCLKASGHDLERGRVVERTSQRTHRPYLTVQILSGRRRWLFEFPERGWRLDDGTDADSGDSNSPRQYDHEEDYYGSEAWKTRHHARASKKYEAKPERLTAEQLEAARKQREQDEKDLPF